MHGQLKSDIAGVTAAFDRRRKPGGSCAENQLSLRAAADTQVNGRANVGRPRPCCRCRDVLSVIAIVRPQVLVGIYSPSRLTILIDNKVVIRVTANNGPIGRAGKRAQSRGNCVCRVGDIQRRIGTGSRQRERFG